LNHHPSCIPILGLTLALGLAPEGKSQSTTHDLAIGGLGAKGCQEPPRDPPELSNGTAASGSIEFTYDAATHILDLVVHNTSPVTRNVPNPLITQIAFNLPPDAVSGALLLSQSGAGGVSPFFWLAVDPDVQHPPNIEVDCMGRFSALLSIPTIYGGIGNPAADRYAIPDWLVVEGPAMFRIKLFGPGVSSLSAYAIAAGFSRHASDHNVNAACKFKGGGHGGEGSGYISSVRDGEGCLPSVWLTAPPRIGTTIGICMNGAPTCSGCFLVSLFPGPSVVGPFVIPIGLPFLLDVFLPPLPPNTPFCLPLSIPEDRSLIGRSLYLTLATPGEVRDDLVDFAPRVNVTFLD
jgi:hypothetical protein